MMQESEAKNPKITEFNIFRRPRADWIMFIEEQKARFPGILKASAKEMASYVANHYACHFCSHGLSYLEMTQVKQIVDSLQSQKKVDIYNTVVSQEHRYRLLLSSLITKHQAYKSELDNLNLIVQIILGQKESNIKPGLVTGLMNAANEESFETKSLIIDFKDELMLMLVDLKTKVLASLEHYEKNSINLPFYQEMLLAIKEEQQRPPYFCDDYNSVELKKLFQIYNPDPYFWAFPFYEEAKTSLEGYAKTLKYLNNQEYA